MKTKYFLFFFYGLALLFPGEQNAARSGTGEAVEPPILRPLREILPRILAPLSSGYDTETTIAKSNLMSDHKKYLEKSIDPNPCRLKRREILALLTPGRSISRKIAFTETCPMDGSVNLEGGAYRKVDFTLKDLAPYFRLEAKLRIRKAAGSTSSLIGVELTIADGKLYNAEKPYQPEAEFSGQYKLVIDGEGRLQNTGTGEIYLKKERQKPVERLIPFSLKSAEIP